ncbi:DUF4426 domain-containing protein [Gilvimarinus polysaccharolyticus]|uniref:DUF4426 domain-containing protein n=1 Tax=Gilvimarinus polysaccharolyticus TaxID=863921 RepID=UPI000673828E|nr:DUF4426 domain-containing protein [Gilvimarinus polysaccharolyticus]
MSLFKSLSRRLVAISLLLTSASSVAIDIPDATVLDNDFREQRFGDYTVHFSTFNSAFITPEVAEIYGITRARNQTLINLSVTKTSGDKTSLGLPAKLSGTASNLLQQQSVLDFAEINEGDATYYLAPLKHSNEEVYNFKIQVTVADTAPMTVSFSRKLYQKKAQ